MGRKRETSSPRTMAEMEETAMQALDAIEDVEFDPYEGLSRENFHKAVKDPKVVERLSPTLVTVEIVVGGKLKSRKGINVPELQIACSALTVKDREDAEYLLDARVHGGVDYIALSFAQCARGRG